MGFMLSRYFRVGIVKNAAISLVGFIAAGALGYLFQFLLARRLSVEQYGEFQSLVALFAILGVFGSALSYFVITHTAVFAAARDVAANEQFLRWLLHRVLLVAGVLLAVFLAFTPAVRSLLHLSESWGFVVVSFAALVGLLIVLDQGSLTGWEEFLAVNAIATSGTFLKLIVGLIVVTITPRAAPATLALLASAVGTWLLFRVWGPRRLRARAAHPSETGEDPSSPRRDSEGNDWKTRYFPTRVVQRDLGFVILFTLLITLTQNLDILLVKHFSTAALAGQYSALALAGKLIFWANLGVATVVLPVASARAHAGRPIGARIRLAATGLMLSLGSVAIFLYAIVPSLLLRTALGTPYTVHASALWLFGVMAVPLSLLLLEANFAFARRDIRVTLTLGLVAALMAAGISFFHAGIREIAVSVTAALTAGYFCTLVLNLRSARPVPASAVPESTDQLGRALKEPLALPKY